MPKGTERKLPSHNRGVTYLSVYRLKWRIKITYRPAIPHSTLQRPPGTGAPLNTLQGRDNQCPSAAGGSLKGTLSSGPSVKVTPQMPGSPFSRPFPKFHILQNTQEQKNRRF